MWKNRLFYTFLTVITIAVLAAILGTVRYFVRNAALQNAAEHISKKYFDGEKPQIDLNKRTVVFSSDRSEFLRNLKLSGKVTFSFPVKFFELPWNVKLASIAVKDVIWDLNLKENTVNNRTVHDFLKQIPMDEFSSVDNGNKFPDLITYGTLKLTNPEGETRHVAMRSILKKNKNQSLLGVYAGDMKVNFLYNSETKKLVGQYQAHQSDFEFFRLSFGLPELFTMHGVGNLSGQFQYDNARKQIEYIRGSAKFGMEAAVQGSIFSIYGSRQGMINWEYLNSQNWYIELRNATSGRPFRTKLHYLVLSQNTMEQDSVSFDGEIEFYPATFSKSFGLEFDRRTAAVRHRLVGKWNMKDKSWELSRLAAGRQIPQVKLKWNDFDIAFQNRSFKLSGSGAQSDHFAFHYELEMANADWKDKDKNTVITSHAKLEGDCILSLSDDTLPPVSTGKLSCEVADGALDNTRFLLKNVFLTFAPDAGNTTKYKFSVGEFSVGLPDLQKGVRLDILHLNGESGVSEFNFSAPSLNIRYKDFADIASTGPWSFKRRKEDGKIVFNTSGLQGKLFKKEFKAGRVSALFDKNILNWNCNFSLYDIKAGINTFQADELQGNVNGENESDSMFACRKLTLKPVKWQFNGDILRCESLSSVFDIEFKQGANWSKWAFNAGQFSFTYSGRNYIVPGLVCGETNQGEYSEGVFNGHGTPYRGKFDYTRKNGSKTVTVRNGSINGNYEFFRGLTGDINFLETDKLLSADFRFDDLKMKDSRWEHGALGFELNKRNGFELISFNGISSTDTSRIKFTGKDSSGANVFEVKNFPAKYVEAALNAGDGTLSGLFDGKVAMASDEFFNPFKIQTFYLKNNQVMRLRFESLDKFAQKGDSIEDQFAGDALKDFFAKSLLLDYHRVGGYRVLDVKALGKCTDLLPYEFDVKEKKLKKSDVALFNSEVEVIMKYIMK